MNTRASHLLIVLLLATELFAQVGLVATSCPALATHRSFPAPAPKDADPVDETTPEDGDERGEGSTWGDPDFGVPSSRSSRRGVSCLSSLQTGPTLPAARACRLGPGAGHFLAAGRELRYWIQSQLC